MLLLHLVLHCVLHAYLVQCCSCLGGQSCIQHGPEFHDRWLRKAQRVYVAAAKGAEQSERDGARRKRERTREDRGCLPRAPLLGTA